MQRIGKKEQERRKREKNKGCYTEHRMIEPGHTPRGRIIQRKDLFTGL